MTEIKTLEQGRPVYTEEMKLRKKRILRNESRIYSDYRAKTCTKVYSDVC